MLRVSDQPYAITSFIKTSNHLDRGKVRYHGACSHLFSRWLRHFL